LHAAATDPTSIDAASMAISRQAQVTARSMISGTDTSSNLPNAD